MNFQEIAGRVQFDGDEDGFVMRLLSAFEAPGEPALKVEIHGQESAVPLKNGFQWVVSCYCGLSFYGDGLANAQNAAKRHHEPDAKKPKGHVIKYRQRMPVVGCKIACVCGSVFSAESEQHAMHAFETSKHNDLKAAWKTPEIFEHVTVYAKPRRPEIVRELGKIEEQERDEEPFTYLELLSMSISRLASVEDDDKILNVMCRTEDGRRATVLCALDMLGWISEPESIANAMLGPAEGRPVIMPIGVPAVARTLSQRVAVGPGVEIDLPEPDSVHIVRIRTDEGMISIAETLLVQCSNGHQYRIWPENNARLERIPDMGRQAFEQMMREAGEVIQAPPVRPFSPTDRATIDDGRRIGVNLTVRVAQRDTIVALTNLLPHRLIVAGVAFDSAVRIEYPQAQDARLQQRPQLVYPDGSWFFDDESGRRDRAPQDRVYGRSQEMMEADAIREINRAVNARIERLTDPPVFTSDTPMTASEIVARHDRSLQGPLPTILSARDSFGEEMPF